MLGLEQIKCVDLLMWRILAKLGRQTFIEISSFSKDKAPMLILYVPFSAPSRKKSVMVGWENWTNTYLLS
jgi:hypothetical protein